MLHETALGPVTGLILIGQEGKYAAICKRKHINTHRKYVVLEISNTGHQG